MVSKITDWENNIGFQSIGNTDSFYTIISIDDVTGEYLLLFVNLTKYSKISSEYSYGFMLLDNNLNPKTELLTR